MTRAFLFEQDLRRLDPSEVSLSDATKIRRDSADGVRLLGSYSAALRRSVYPTSGGPWSADLPTITAPRMRGLLAVDVEEEVATGVAEFDRLDPLPTSFAYQVLVAGVAYYWTGATWGVASGLGDANTLADLQARIGEDSLTELLLAGGGVFALRLVLATSNRSYSPAVPVVRWLVDVGERNALEDLKTSLVDALGALAIPGVFVATNTTGGPISSLDLAVDAFRLRTRFRFSDVPKVFDLDADPNRTTNLATGAFVPATTTVRGLEFSAGVKPLASSVPAGRRLEIHFEHTVPAVLSTSRDYDTGPDLPEIQIREIRAEEELEDPAVEVVARRTNPGDGVDDVYHLEGGRTLWVSLVLGPRGPDPAVVDQIGSALRAWLGRSRLLPSTGFGVGYALDARDAGGLVDEDQGLIARWDLEVVVYNARDPGTATAAKAVRTVEVAAGYGPQR